jgi:alkanesulfonate monooxygenase SsuD/methylene tetrahydromethanopterin reductase-like flavin-dependent oxidoreductase (luciferase family)
VEVGEGDRAVLTPRHPIRFSETPAAYRLPPPELDGHGAELRKWLQRRRWSVMAERVKAMRRIREDDVAEFRGEHVRFGPLWSWPKPHRPSGPPVLVGGSGPLVASRVLDFGDEWMPHAGTPAAEPAERVAKLRAAGVRPDAPMTCR